MDDGGVTVKWAFDRSGKHPGLTTDELYWLLNPEGYRMVLFKDGEACRDKQGDLIYVLCRPHKPMQDYAIAMQIREIKWMMGEL